MVHLSYRTSKSGVPIISDADIDVHAERFLRDYNKNLLKEPQALDVEDFTENYLKLNIHYENLSHNGCILGMMVFNNRKIPVYVPELDRAEDCPIDANTVVIDNRLLPDECNVLFRSTMMHECGHGVYDREVFQENDDQLSFLFDDPEGKLAIAVCRKADIVGGNVGKRRLVTDRDWSEHHAKYFSAATLMPKPAMKLLCNELLGACSGEDSLEEYEFMQFEVADIFNVSPASAGIRMRQLNLLPTPKNIRRLHLIKKYSTGVFSELSV